MREQAVGGWVSLRVPEMSSWEGLAMPHLPAPQSQSLPVGAQYLPTAPRTALALGSPAKSCGKDTGAGEEGTATPRHAGPHWLPPPLLLSPTRKEGAGSVCPYSQLWEPG